MENRFIVAEITKNWKQGAPVNSQMLISQQFEKVINTNLERGYKLTDWKIVNIVNNDTLTETIIAIFEKI